MTKFLTSRSFYIKYLQAFSNGFFSIMKSFFPTTEYGAEAWGAITAILVLLSLAIGILFFIASNLS